MDAVSGEEKLRDEREISINTATNVPQDMEELRSKNAATSVSEQRKPRQTPKRTLGFNHFVRFGKKKCKHHPEMPNICAIMTKIVTVWEYIGLRLQGALPCDPRLGFKRLVHTNTRKTIASPPQNDRRLWDLLDQKQENLARTPSAKLL